ncbi:MAG: MalM family protein [Marinobacter sp.]|uniref:MalM family protein n=1 Tax=Marinobacter sp. TaxID=50741 RepID=UPI00299EFFBB|nr:MalM family protein [Marinobacter sp.]MDX1756585.1 MalM family protein [Marinobacter sp.]
MAWRRGVWLGCLPLMMTMLAGCQSADPRQGEVDYFTWVDEQGRVRQTQIRTEPQPPEDTRPIDEVAAEIPAPGEPTEPEHEEYSLANYPDGNELAAAGFVRDGDPQPYFTWRDAQGNIRVSYYQPDTRSLVAQGKVEPPVALTPASVYHRTDRQPALPNPDALPEAFGVLGIEIPAQGYFQQWSARCCEGLGLIQVQEWQSGREFSVTIDHQAPTHEFVTGTSPYRLIHLPADRLPASFVLRLRSFSRDGLFVPSLAFLDDSLTPIRIVTDLVAPYAPESWHSHGYLQAYLPVFPARGERWLLLYTRDSDVNSQTVVEEGPRPRVIPHRQTGLIGLSMNPD